MADLLVCGYPRSGTVWISRLLGDVLDRPVVGKGGTLSLATEGKKRPGPGRVMQAHVYLGQGKQFWCANSQIDLQFKGDRKVLLVVRDPRDVLLSVAAFWNWSLEETMHKMADGPGPVEMPPWKAYVDSWLNSRVPIVRYEDFHADAEAALCTLLAVLNEVPKRPLGEVVERQSFAAKRAEMEQYGDTYPFGRAAQLQHLRRGETGEWRTALPSHLARQVLSLWKRQLSILGYYHESMSCA